MRCSHTTLWLLLRLGFGFHGGRHGIANRLNLMAGARRQLGQFMSQDVQGTLLTRGGQVEERVDLVALLASVTLAAEKRGR
jgi:hypothetical protein